MKRIPHNQFVLGDHIAQMAGVINRCANAFTDAYTMDKDETWKKNWLRDLISKMQILEDEMPALLEVAKKYNLDLYPRNDKPLFKPQDFRRKKQ